MTAHLIMVDGSMKGQKILIKKPITAIGRVECDIALSDPDVSRRHAEIRKTNDGYEIEDLNSSNGTMVDGIPIRRTALRQGARVALGKSAFVFFYAADSARAADPAVADTLSLDTRNLDPLEHKKAGKDVNAMARAQADLAALYRVGQMINTLLRTEELCDALLKAVMEEMPKVDACSVHFWDEQTRMLQCRGHHAREAIGQPARPLFSRAILHMVLKERKAVLTSDTFQDERLGESPSIMTLNIQSAMCVPLQSRNRLFGMLQANVLASDRRLAEDDLRLLAAIGIQAGSALENALLYEQLAAEKTALQEAHEKLRTAQETLIRSEKLAAVGRLSAGVVHDVKNPMAIILLRAQMLMRDLTGPAPVAVDNAEIVNSLQEIEAGVLQCNSVINGLLQFARPAHPQKMAVSPNTLIADLVRFLAYEIKKAKATVTTDLAGDVAPVWADAGQLKQVLLNLLINAMQALDGGGRIFIATGHVKDATPAMVFISIRDTGCGMSAEVKRHLFEPFFSSKPLGEGAGGMGLGLSISHDIVQQHGGTMEVASEVGQGTTFTIKLPAHGARRHPGADARAGAENGV